MRILLDSLAEYPALIYATKKAGIHRRTPEYWLKGSEAGHEGYDLEWRGETAKFHEHYISAMDEGGGHLEEVVFRLATGYDEILTYRGRVSYKFDPVLRSLGHQGPDAYLKDENGDPVPETVRKFKGLRRDDPMVAGAAASRQVLATNGRSTFGRWTLRIRVACLLSARAVGNPRSSKKSSAVSSKFRKIRI